VPVTAWTLIRQSVRVALQELIEAEATERIRAALYERTESRYLSEGSMAPLYPDSDNGTDRGDRPRRVATEDPLKARGAPPRQTIRDDRVLITRKLIAWAFMYSLDGLLADEGTEYWQSCFGLPVDPAELKQEIDLCQSAYAHMGRTALRRHSQSLADGRPPVHRHHERRAQGRLLPDSDDGRVGQHHHRRW